MYYVSISTLFVVFPFIIVPNAAMLRSAFPTTQRAACGTGERYSSRVTILADVGSGAQEVLCLAVLIPQDDLPTGTHLMVTSSTCANTLKGATRIIAERSDGFSQGVHRNAFMRGNLAVIKSRDPFKFTDSVGPACLPGDGDNAIPGSGYMYTISEWSSQYGLSKTNVNIPSGTTTTGPLFWATDGDRYPTNIPTGTPYLVYDETKQRHTLWGVANSPVRCSSTHHEFTSIPAYLRSIKQLMSGNGAGWERETTS